MPMPAHKQDEHVRALLATAGGEHALHSETESWRLAAIFFIFVSSILGAAPPLFISAFKDPDNPLTRLLRCFSAGVILALPIVHIIPDALEQMAAVSPDFPLGAVSILAGIILLAVLEHALHCHADASCGRETGTRKGSCSETVGLGGDHDLELGTSTTLQDSDGDGDGVPADSGHRSSHDGTGRWGGAGNGRQVPRAAPGGGRAAPSYAANAVGSKGHSVRKPDRGRRWGLLFGGWAGSGVHSSREVGCDSESAPLVSSGSVGDAVPQQYHGHLRHHHGMALDQQANDRGMRQQIVAYIFELGCVVHSFIIGLGLGVIVHNVALVRALVIALCCHQFLEGITLGAVVVRASFSLSRALWLVLTFAATTPLGVALGMALAGTYGVNSVAATAVQGALNGISSGMLLYIALVQMVAQDFGRPPVPAPPQSTRLWQYFMLLAGASLMCVLALWA